MKISSNRSFGLVMAGVCVIFSLFPLFYAATPNWWLLCIAATFFSLSVVKPILLGPLNRIWASFGLLLAKIANPVVLSFMYYFIVSPVALGTRFFGRDPLQRKFEPELDTYWQNKDPVGPAPETMKNQY